MTTKMTRLGTYGSAHKEEDSLWAQICKSLPLPAFVSKTPRPAGLFSAVALCTRVKVWKTPSQSVLNLHTVVWEKGCCSCFLFLFSSGGRMAGLSKASFPPVRFLQLACDLRGTQQCGEPHPSNVKDPLRSPTWVVMTAWFPALWCLSASLVSCRCCGKHATLFLLLLFPPPLLFIIKN